MTFNENKQGSLLILQAQGRLDASSAPETDRRLAALIAGGARHLVFDLTGVEYVSSAGLRVLLAAAKHMQQAQGKLVLAGLRPQIRQIFDMAGFATILPIFATVPDAIGSATATMAGSSVPAAIPLAHGLFSFAEELFLLALDDQKCELRPPSTAAFANAMAAALLMELALCGRIDTDLSTLTVTSAAPTGNPLLDDMLRQLQQQPVPQSTAFWLKRLADRSGHIEDQVLAGLIRKGVLKQENRRILWVFEMRRYPIIDDREIKEVRLRLRELILSDDIPDPRDVVLICLGKACRLLDHLFAPEEYSRVRCRIDALARLDLIGREMSRIVSEIDHAMTMALRDLKL